MAYVEKDKMKIYNKTPLEKFKSYTGKVEKETAVKFDEKLKNSNMTFSFWLNQNIKRYLENL